MAPTGIGAGALLAHQGGWDEILMVLTPIALFAALLWLANSRATRLQQQGTSPTEATPADDRPEAEPADDPAHPPEEG